MPFIFSEMHITLHLAFAAVVCFAVSECRQQQHDIGEYFDFFLLLHENRLNPADDRRRRANHSILTTECVMHCQQ